MKQSRTYRKWAQRQFNAGGTETIDLPLGADLESIHLYLIGTLTNSVAWTSCKIEGLAKLIKRVELLANGETIATINGELLTHGNFVRQAGVIKVNPLATVSTSPCEIVGFFDLSHVSGVRPKDSNLRTKGFRQLQLRITWGQFTDVFLGAGTTSANTLALTVSVRETKEYGDENGFSPAPEIRKLHRIIEKTYPASMVDRIQLDPNLLYRAIVIRAETLGELSSAVINSVKVQLGTDVIIDLDAAVIADANSQDYSWALPAGYFVVDFAPCPSGLAKISDFLDTTGRNGDAFLIVDVVGGATTKLQFCSHQFDWQNDAIAANSAYRGQQVNGHNQG